MNGPAVLHASAYSPMNSSEHASPMSNGTVVTKSLRLMSSMKAWDGSNPLGGRDTDSPQNECDALNARPEMAFFYTSGLAAMASRMRSRVGPSGFQMPAPHITFIGSRCR